LKQRKKEIAVSRQLKAVSQKPTAISLFLVCQFIKPETFFVKPQTFSLTTKTFFLIPEPICFNPQRLPFDTKIFCL
jgi:hypothetical protein